MATDNSMISSVRTPISIDPPDPKGSDEQKAQATLGLSVATAVMVGAVLVLGFAMSSKEVRANPKLTKALTIAVSVLSVATAAVAIAAAVELHQNKDLLCKFDLAVKLQGTSSPPLAAMIAGPKTAFAVGTKSATSAALAADDDGVPTQAQALKLKILSQSMRSSLALSTWVADQSLKAISWAAIKIKFTDEVKEQIEKEIAEEAAAIGERFTRQEWQVYSEAQVQKLVGKELEEMTNSKVTQLAAGALGVASVAGIALLTSVLGAGGSPDVNLAELKYELAVIAQQIENFTVQFTQEFQQVTAFGQTLCVAKDQIGDLGRWLHENFYTNGKMSIFDVTQNSAVQCDPGQCCKLRYNTSGQDSSITFKATDPMRFPGENLWKKSCEQTDLFTEFLPLSKDNFALRVMKIITHGGFTEICSPTPYTTYSKYTPPHSHVYADDALEYPPRKLSILPPYLLTVADIDRTSAMYMNLAKVQMFMRLISLLKDYMNVFVAYGMYFKSKSLIDGMSKLIKLFAYMLDIIDMSVAYGYEFKVAPGVAYVPAFSFLTTQISVMNHFLGCGSLIEEGARILSLPVNGVYVDTPERAQFEIERIMKMFKADDKEFAEIVTNDLRRGLNFPRPELKTASAKLALAIALNDPEAVQLLAEVRQLTPKPRSVRVWVNIDSRVDSGADWPFQSFCAGISHPAINQCPGDKYQGPQMSEVGMWCYPANTPVEIEWPVVVKEQDPTIQDIPMQFFKMSTLLYGGGRWFTAGFSDENGNVKPEYASPANPWVKNKGWFNATLYPHQYLTIVGQAHRGEDSFDICPTTSAITLSYDDLKDGAPSTRVLAGNSQKTTDKSLPHSYVGFRPSCFNTSFLVWDDPATAPVYPGDSIQVLELVDRAHTIINHKGVMNLLFTDQMKSVVPTTNPNLPPRKVDKPATQLCGADAPKPTQTIAPGKLPAQILNPDPAFNGYDLMSDYLQTQIHLRDKLDGCYCKGDNSKSCTPPTLPADMCQYTDSYGNAVTLGAGNIPFGTDDMCETIMSTASPPCEFPLCNPSQMRDMSKIKDRECDVSAFGSLTCVKSGQCLSNGQAPDACKKSACFLGNNFWNGTYNNKCNDNPTEAGCLSRIGQLRDPAQRKAGDKYEAAGLAVAADAAAAQAYIACCENGACPCNNSHACVEYACPSPDPAQCNNNRNGTCQSHVDWVMHNRKPGDKFEKGGLAQNADANSTQHYLWTCEKADSECYCSPGMKPDQYKCVF